MLQGDLKAQGEEMGQLLRHEVKTVYLLPLIPWSFPAWESAGLKPNLAKLSRESKESSLKAPVIPDLVRRSLEGLPSRRGKVGSCSNLQLNTRE